MKSRRWFGAIMARFGAIGKCTLSKGRGKGETAGKLDQTLTDCNLGLHFVAGRGFALARQKLTQPAVRRYTTKTMDS